jgi:MFS family permease
MISLARYTTLLERPGLGSLILASALGRLPIGIAGLAILLLGQSASGSFALGGVASACYVAGLAFAAPLLGRSIDRYGPRPALLASAFVFPSAMAGVVAAFHAGAPTWAALALAALCGASFPPITSCMRSFLKQQLKEDEQLTTAMSLESVLIETIFIAGPMIVAFFVALASPAFAVLFAAACGCAGPLLFLRARAIRQWRIEPRGVPSLFGPLSEPAFARLLVVVLFYASAFGLVEIATTAHASERGSLALAGVLLGVMSIGSVVGGVVYGSRSWHLPLARQFALTLALMGAGVAPLAFGLPEWLFAIWCVVAGIVMAPALIMQSMLVAKTSRPEHSAEAFTWSATSLLSGVGIGLTLGGQILEYAPSPVVFAAAAAIAICAAALALPLVRV